MILFALEREHKFHAHTFITLPCTRTPKCHIENIQYLKIIFQNRLNNMQDKLHVWKITDLLCLLCGPVITCGTVTLRKVSRITPMLSVFPLSLQKRQWVLGNKAAS